MRGAKAPPPRPEVAGRGTRLMNRAEDIEQIRKAAAAAAGVEVAEIRTCRLRAARVIGKMA